MKTVTVTGFIVARSLEEGDRLSALVPAHVAETRAEPGCLTCEIWRSRADPVRFALRTVFADRAALAAHEARCAESLWGKATCNVPSDLHVTEGLARAIFRGPGD